MASNHDTKILGPTHGPGRPCNIFHGIITRGEICSSWLEAKENVSEKLFKTTNETRNFEYKESLCRSTNSSFPPVSIPIPIPVTVSVAIAIAIAVLVISLSLLSARPRRFIVAVTMRS